VQVFWSRNLRNARFLGYARFSAALEEFLEGRAGILWPGAPSLTRSGIILTFARAGVDALLRQKKKNKRK
jgi:hypothetical protein